MAKPTAAAVRKYVTSGGAACPFCESSNIEGGEHDCEGTFSWQEVSCLDCEATWQDVYTLTGISVTDEHGNSTEYSAGIAT